MLHRILLLSLLCLPALAQEKTPEERLRPIIEKLMHGTPEEKAKAEKDLVDLVHGGEFGGTLTPGVQVVAIGGPGGGEKMSGLWTEEGRKGTYELKSLGDGRYALTAVAKDAAGDETKTTDEGSLADLRRKHTFLKEMVMIGLGARMELAIDVKACLPEASGMTLKKPSEELRYHLALPEGAGLLVEQVQQGSEAERIGIERFDVIVKVGEDLVTKAEQLAEIGTSPVEILRRAQPRTLNKRG